MPSRPQHPCLRIAVLAWLALAGGGAVQAATIRVACVGDSITYGAGSSSPSTLSYPVQLAGLLGSGYTVGNFGHSGATMLHAGDLPYVNVAEYPASDAFAPDIVVIMLGTNDSKPQNWQYQSQFAADDAALIAHYRALPSHPLVFSCTDCPVYGSGNFGITEAVVHGEVIPLILATAAAVAAPVIDVYTAMSGIPQDFPDNVHPDDAGYALLAQAVYRSIHPPVAAGALSATAVSAGRVDLAWSDLSDNETAFRIERRSAGAGAFAAIGSAAAGATGFGDTGAAASTAYDYRVVALNASGDGPASNQATATTPAAPPAASSSRRCGHGGFLGASLLLTLAGLRRGRRAGAHGAGG
jgi:lysophospholipase L1-like esterase